MNVIRRQVFVLISGRILDIKETDTIISGAESCEKIKNVNEPVPRLLSNVGLVTTI